MKKALSILLSLTLACGLGLPALAAEPAVDQQLAQVTAKVKSTLGIGDEYTEFQGALQVSGPLSLWELNWANKGDSLNILADTSGKVLRYTYNSDTGAATPDRASLPAFPKTDRAAAQVKAEAFLKRVLTPGTEIAVFHSNTNNASTNQHYFSGNIQLNGLPSPIGFRISVQAEDGSILSFYRDDVYTGYVGGAPSATPATGADKAAALLKGTLSMRLEYVLDKSGNSASLRYLPNTTDEFYVDAQTGTLVNLTELRDVLEANRRLYGGGSTQDAEAGAALSAAEQAGIAKLEGVLSQEALDKKVRAVEGLMLSGYSLVSFQYAVERETDAVCAVITYREGGEDSRWRTVTVDARTGALQSISGGSPYEEERAAKLTEEQAKAKAEAFLKAHWSEAFATTALYEQMAKTASGYDNFLFTRKVAGYFFPENTFDISVDVQDGSICSLQYDYDADIAFESAEGLISADDALDAWFETYQTPLAYLAVPVQVDPTSPQAKPYLDTDMRYYYSLKLGYALEGSADGFIGIDAKTGQPVRSPWTEDTSVLTYSDLDSCWAKAQIESLAEYGIGYYGGNFQPDKQLTQLDLVALLISTDGYCYDLSQEGMADEVYRAAYQMGFLTAAQRKDSAPLSRAETVQLILDSAGYGDIAQLKGIFKCSFSDADQIPAAYYGYAAIAQGMGMVSGGSNGAFAPNRTATRVEAAVMLYHFMDR